jgi:4-amino-4-deoxy-L-arabinose transferase-like glycosyltransferase
MKERLAVHGGVAIGLAAVFGAMAVFRLIDADEGIYLLNARDLTRGLVPYIDFSFPQAPLLLYVYGAWMKVFGVSWYSARLLSAALAVALGLLVYRHVAVVTGRVVWGVAAAVILASSTLAFSWYTTVKTFGLAALLLFLAYHAVSSGSARRRYLLAGVCLGLAIDTRYYLAVVVPLFAAEAWRERERLATLGRFMAGVAIGLIPGAIFLLVDADKYIFDIVGTHVVRSDSGPIGAFGQKIKVLRYLLGLHTTWGLTSVASIQFALLAFTNLALLIFYLVARRPLRLSMGISIAVSLVSLMPTPTYVQYFCLALPFLVVDAVIGVAPLIDRHAATDAGARARWLPWAAGIGLAVYVLVAPIDIYWHIAGGFIVPGVGSRENAKNWTIPAVQRIGRTIDEEMPPNGGTVISWWPGYFVETRSDIYPKLRNPWSLWYYRRMPREDVARYGLVTHEELVANIRAHAVPVVVLGNLTFDAKDQYRFILQRSGYRLVKQLDDTEIYRAAEATR